MYTMYTMYTHGTCYFDLQISGYELIISKPEYLVGLSGHLCMYSFKSRHVETVECKHQNPSRLIHSPRKNAEHNHNFSLPDLEAVDSVVKMFCHGFPSAILIHLSSIGRWRIARKEALCNPAWVGEIGW